MEFNEKNALSFAINSHLYSKKERLLYLEFLKKSDNSKENLKMFLSIIGNLLHTYFYCMDNFEKEILIRIICNLYIEDIQILGEFLELLGIIFKGAPRKLRKVIFEYISLNVNRCIISPSAIISSCNCLSYIYDELSKKDKAEIISILKFLKKSKIDYIDNSIDLTLSIILEDDK